MRHQTRLLALEQTRDNWQINHHSLNGSEVTSIIAREGVILAGTRDGLFYSDDGGHSWADHSQGLTYRHLRWLAYHPDISDFELAGTEPAAIFVSRDGSRTWHGSAEVETLREERGWWLPYSPAAGCVRGFALHGRRLYAAVEVGGLLRSDDQGQTWQLAPGSSGHPQFQRPTAGQLHADVHSLAVHPSSPDLIFAPTGGGFYRSADGGHTWECLYANCYVRAVWVDETDPHHMVLGPSAGADGRDGRIEQTVDGGQSWQPLTARQTYNMVERFYQAENKLFAVMSNGQLWFTDRQQLHWQTIGLTLPPINAVTIME